MRACAGGGGALRDLHVQRDGEYHAELGSDLEKGNDVGDGDVSIVAEDAQVEDGLWGERL